MRPISEIIIHCTATKANWWHDKSTADKVAEIRRWHTLKPPHGRGWRDIGYHFLIDRDGTTATGRPLDQVGAHVQGHNTGTIGISLFGGDGSNEKDDFSDHFTRAQDASLRVLIDNLRRQFPAIRRISGHNEYAAKACPGFTVSEWLDDTPMASPPAAQQAGKPVQPPITATSTWTRLLAALVAIFTRKGK